MPQFRARRKQKRRPAAVSACCGKREDKALPCWRDGPAGCLLASNEAVVGRRSGPRHHARSPHRCTHGCCPSPAGVVARSPKGGPPSLSVRSPATCRMWARGVCQRCGSRDLALLFHATCRLLLADRSFAATTVSRSGARLACGVSCPLPAAASSRPCRAVQTWHSRRCEAGLEHGPKGEAP